MKYHLKLSKLCSHFERERVNNFTNFTFLCMISLIPLLQVDLPPLVDLYGHLGRYAIQTELTERPQLEPFFEFEWTLIGNLGADLLVEIFHPLFGLEGSVKAVLIIVQLFACSGLIALSKEVHGRITPFTLAALPLIYSLPFNYGFINYCFSMALALLSFSLWLRLRRIGKRPIATLSLLLSGCAIWVVHTYGWAFLGLLCGAVIITEFWANTNEFQKFSLFHSMRRSFTACWPLMIPSIFMALWHAKAGTGYWGGWSLSIKLVWIASSLRYAWKITDILSIIFIIFLIFWALREERLHCNAILLTAALLSLACYLLLPMFVMGSAFADMRLAPYTIALCLVAISCEPLPKHKLKILTALSFSFLIFRTSIIYFSYIEQNKVVQAHLLAVDKIPPGSKLAVLVVKPCNNPWALPVIDHVGSLAMVRRNIFVNDQWAGAGVNPLRVTFAAGGRFVQDPSQIVQANGCKKRIAPTLSASLNAIPLAAFTHVWVIGQLPDEMPTVPELKPVAHRGEGRIYSVRAYP